MAVIEEPILPKLDRLDIMLRQLEDIKNCTKSSPRSSCASIPSSGTLTSDGHPSSYHDFSPKSMEKHGYHPINHDISPKSLEKHCRPVEFVLMETEAKGTLIERLDHVEERILKLCMELEEELEAEKKREEKAERKTGKKGIKKLVKTCVKF